MHIPNVPAAEPRCERYTVSFDGKPADVMAARVSAVPFNCSWPGQQRPLLQVKPLE